MQEHKKQWETPVVVVHGDMKTITQLNKEFSGADGITVGNQPVGNTGGDPNT